MRRTAIVIILIANLLSSVHAVNRDVENICTDIKMSQQVDECVVSQYKLADHELNRMYKQVMTKIDIEYKNFPLLGEEFRASVKKAQQAWIKFRDASCEIEAFEIEANSVAHQTTFKDCLVRMTNVRIRELQKLAQPINS